MGPEAVVDILQPWPSLVINVWVEARSARLVFVFLHIDDTIPSVGHNLMHMWEVS